MPRWGTRLWRQLSLKGRVKVCAVYIFHLILYCLFVLPLPRNHRLALQQSLQITLGRPMVHRQGCCPRPSNRGLRMPDLENYWFTERLAYLGRSLSTDAVWRQGTPFLALSQTPRLKVNISQGAKHCLPKKAVRPFATFLGPVTFLSLKRTSGGLQFGSSCGSAGRWRRFTRFGIGRQVWALWTILSSYSPGSLAGMCYLFLAWITEHAWQIYLIVLAAVVA